MINDDDEALISNAIQAMEIAVRAYNNLNNQIIAVAAAKGSPMIMHMSQALLCKLVGRQIAHNSDKITDEVADAIDYITDTLIEKVIAQHMCTVSSKHFAMDPNSNEPN